MRKLNKRELKLLRTPAWRRACHDCTDPALEAAKATCEAVETWTTLLVFILTACGIGWVLAPGLWDDELSLPIALVIFLLLTGGGVFLCSIPAVVVSLLLVNVNPSYRRAKAEIKGAVARTREAADAEEAEEEAQLAAVRHLGTKEFEDTFLDAFNRQGFDLSERQHLNDSLPLFNLTGDERQIQVMLWQKKTPLDLATAQAFADAVLAAEATEGTIVSRGGFDPDAAAHLESQAIRTLNEDDIVRIRLGMMI